MRSRIEALQPYQVAAVFDIDAAGGSHWSIDSFNNSLAAGHYCRVSIQENEITGFIIARLNKDWGEIPNLGVAPEHRRKGTGVSLLDRVFDRARQLNLNVIQLEVRALNHAALRLYQKTGFSIDGIRKDYYRTRVKEDAILMTRRLHWTGL